MIKVCKVQRHGLFGEMELQNNYLALNNALCSCDSTIYSVPRALLVYVLQESALLGRFQRYLDGKNEFRKQRITAVE